MSHLNLKYITSIFLLLYIFLYPLYTYSANKQPSDVQYYIHENNNFSMIFHKDFLKQDKQDFIYIHNKLSYYDKIFKKTFRSKLKDKPIYVFSSSRNQISNAIASNIPFLKVIFFSTGVDQINKLASTSWEDTVITHEMTHIFQLGQTSDKLSLLNLLFKSSEVIFLPIPIFLNVNLTIPMFLLEGHAVLHESIFANGGRLYSGFTRALLFSQIKNKFKSTKQFTTQYIINRTEDTFSNRQHYSHGGYFFNALIKKYDLKTINSFFTNYAEHFIFPLSFSAMKATFKTTFDTSFQSLVHYYINHYRPLALQQKKSTEKPLFNSSICHDFNKQDNEVMFITSDLKSTPYLKSLNLITNRWTINKKVFSTYGKIFKINKEYLISTSHQINTQERVYGLFSEGMYFKKYKSQSVQDIYKNQVLSLDTTNNFHGFKLLLNNKYYDSIHSTALFGPSGDIYYFKQNKNQRILYKNKIPVFKFKGFYGKLVEIDKNNTVYFIASTKFGSSLFAWNHNLGIYRVLNSDVIINAIKISKDNFLVCEINPNSYSYKIIASNIIAESPHFYDYNFKKIDDSVAQLYNTSDDKKLNINPLATSPLYTNFKLNNLPYSFYNGIKSIRFSGIHLGLDYDSKLGNYNGLVNISFKDPLEYNSFYISYIYSLDYSALQTKYINTTYLLSWGIKYMYKQGLANFLGSRKYSYIHELSYDMSFPLLKAGYWLSTLNIKTAIASLELKKTNAISYYSSVKPTVQLQYGRIYSKNFDFYRRFLLTASLPIHFKFINKDLNIKKSLLTYYSVNLGWEFYTTAFFTYQSALKKQSFPLIHFKSLNLSDTMNVNLFLNKRTITETNKYMSGGFSIQKFIKTPIYFLRFPISLSGIAPLLNGKYIQFLNNKTNQFQQLVEWTSGVKLKILLHHKVHTNINFYYGYSIPVDSFFTFNTTWDIQNQNLHFGVKLNSQF